MARTLIKLACGIIHTAEFADYIRQVHEREARRHPHEVLSVDYLRFATGEKKGTEWWQLSWVPQQSAPVAYRHRIGEVEVFVHRQSQRGLRNRCLHCEGGKVVVMA